ncbi:DAF2-like protein, partial [Mya arenaria]
VRVVCENGTRLTVSSDVRTCWDGAWKSGEFPVCKTECGRPPDVQGALPEPEFRDITSFPSGATIQYRCDIKHYLVELTSWSRTCSDGKWDEIQFRCIVKSCPALNTPDNGKRMDFNNEVGSFAKFTCNTGYDMVGVAQLLCRTDMEWSPKEPPTCKPVRCPDDSYLANEEGCEAPIDNGNDAFYRNGTTYTVTHESCSGGNIPSFKGLITCVNGRWSEQVSCLRGASYRITVKTADIKWSVGEGTDGEVYLHMYGSNGNSGKIILHGEFEAGDEDLTVGLCFDVGEISKIKLGVNALSFSYDGWKPESVQIEDVSRGVYYAFKHDLTEVDDTSIILYPVGGKANILG